MIAKLIRDINYRNDPKYRFVLNEPSEIIINLGNHSHLYTSKGRPWASYENGVLKIMEGYAWNGASPAYRALGVWIAPPCPHSVIVSSLWHDLMWQFAPLEKCLWDFKIGNDVFYGLMSQLKFPLRDIYHGAVKNIGPAYRKFLKREDISCIDAIAGIEYRNFRK